jgi:Zn-dependent metalloprotease
MKQTRQSRFSMILLFVTFITFAAIKGHAQNRKQQEKQALGELKAKFGAQLKIGQSRATGKVNFVRLDAGVSGALYEPTSLMVLKRAVTEAFLRSYGAVFGLSDPATELTLTSDRTDELGSSHITFKQTYKGLAVFGGTLAVHFDTKGQMRSVNGTIVPNIDLETAPTEDLETAKAIAIAAVSTENQNATGLNANDVTLLVYRSGIVQGVSGENHLAWQFTIGNDSTIREFVFVDAHSGKIIDQFSGKYDALNRRIYNGNDLPWIPPIGYPSNPFWSEGMSFPTGNSEGDEIILASKDTYDFYRTAFGRDSYNGVGGSMVSFFNVNFGGLNAFQTILGNGQVVTVYSNGIVADDVIAHEWTHAYTYFTHGLIYAWQPGALNEAYSDIFGETIDLLNARGSDTPGGTRNPSGTSCTIHSPPPQTLRVNSPSTIAGDYQAAFDYFGPPVPLSGLTGKVVQVDDGVGVGGDGCSSPFVNEAAVRGNIALIVANATPIGSCVGVTKALNAEANGAIGVLFANDAELGEALFSFISLGGPEPSIPSINVRHSVGEKILGSGGANVTIIPHPDVNSENSFRWLVGEDALFGAGRDMWNPDCFFNPGKVSDSQAYLCSTFDNGGVHENSGIPNHSYALLVDGGNYNGQNIQGIGLTKAAHIYFRAMTLYQNPVTDFADHAEALEAAAADLLGRELPDLRTGLPSGETITGFDLKQLHAATLATELRLPPTSCNFQPLLAKNPPQDSCDLPSVGQVKIFQDSFEGNPFVRWTVRREVGSDATFQGGNWNWVGDLPDGRLGKAFFAYDYPGGCDLPYPSQNGVVELTSPPIKIPGTVSSSPHLSFDHYVGVEEGFDGAQVLISVNGGPYQLVEDSAFLYNAYNETLLSFPYTDNVRGGQRAFTGTDAGSVKGSWGTSIIDLSHYVHPGDTIRIRFDMSTDFCFGTGLGWYVDNVNVYACAAARP